MLMQWCWFARGHQHARERSETHPSFQLYSGDSQTKTEVARMEGFFSPPGDGPCIMNRSAPWCRRNHASGSAGLLVKAGAEQTQGAYSVFEATMPAGASMVNPHTHINEEAWYVVEGTLRFVINDVEYIAEPGSYLLAPRGAVHSY